ncbi:MAG: hsp70 nucleotide exchange factor fes1 [Bogoriella megaspora]|nr:MAG: hsp70 nucleotide exchange factor fes1 [Bogoriella megaspora]
MNDPGLNQLLKWSIENSDASRNDETSGTDTKAVRSGNNGLNPEVLAQLLGGPSDADIMKESIAAILSPQQTMDNKLVAFDNFLQLTENIDNANNIEPLGLWQPLVGLLKSEEPELRKMAAWCCGTAVQNNPKAQDSLLAIGVVPILLDMAINGEEAKDVRKKAISALSSEVRNYQPALDVLLEKLPPEFKVDGKVDAGDMDAVDEIIEKLREDANRAV